MSKHTLYLIPTPISKRKENISLPEHTLNIIKKIRCFVVEKPQTSQSFLQWIEHPTPPYEMTMRVLNKKTPDQEIYSFLKLLKEQDVGLMSEAGAPGVADPGAKLVRLAHDNNIDVVPLVGPSSILMALMASGMNGQSFTFHGYLSINEGKRVREISELEQESSQKNRTQIFMETPHRNEQLFDLLLKKLRPATRLCVASNITQKDEFIQTKTVHHWNKSEKPDLQKKPCLFLIYTGN
ncbi:SAM-dependent methyltransferase [Rhodohalobacter halophilus]|uniref:SAM-dependent methyltransferase n=1 Tax=Rhodohalobacter halophilus TaxID=1812810 RepID=UPI00083F8F77|nr:SAM-dependent methyltransferase [Rhodohalobacter halophilus]